MRRLALPALLLVALAALAARGRAARRKPPTPPRGSPAGAEEHLEVPPPPFSEGIFPCSACHADLKVNRTRRPLTEMHDDIVLQHDEEHRWCLDCHDATDRDWLHLASGERVPFEESYRALRPVPRREAARLEGRSARPAHRRAGTGTSATCSARTATTRTSRASRPLAPKPAPVPPTATGERADEEPSRDERRRPSRAPAAARAGSSPPSPRPPPPAGSSPRCGPKRLREMPKERLQPGRSTRLEREYSAEQGTAVTVADTPRAARRPVRLRARPLPLHRLPPLRLRVRRGEQPVARPAGPLDPRPADGEGEGRRLPRRRPLLPAGRGPGGGPLLRAGRLPAVPQRSLHQGLPDRRDLDGAGRDRGHRLRLVHRLPLLHGGVPLRRPPLQLGRSPTIPQDELNPSTHYLGNRPRPQGRGREVHLLHPARRATGAIRPASRSARWGRASSATCSIRTARSATSSRTSACSS